jgi:hypothetical protein
MIINSAKGNIEADATSGYGKPDLLSALVLDMNSSFGLRVLKDQIIELDQHLVVEITLNKSTIHFSVTPCCIDYPVEKVH